MVTFSVPIKEQECGPNEKEEYFRFSVPEKSVLFAGSRYLEVPQRTCRDLVQQFVNHGFSFLVGCADGVDRSFRRALAFSPYKDRCFAPAYSYSSSSHVQIFLCSLQ